MGLTIDVTIDQAAARDRIVGDPRRLGQVLTNLLGNAVKFKDAGGITLRVDREREDDRERVVLAVSDTGIGIPPADQERVFERFVQVDPTSTRRHGGAASASTSPDSWSTSWSATSR